MSQTKPTEYQFKNTEAMLWDGSNEAEILSWVENTGMEAAISVTQNRTLTVDLISIRKTIVVPYNDYLVCQYATREWLSLPYDDVQYRYVKVETKG